jgi:hypothetical protein
VNVFHLITILFNPNSIVSATKLTQTPAKDNGSGLIDKWCFRRMAGIKWWIESPKNKNGKYFEIKFEN